MDIAAFVVGYGPADEDRVRFAWNGKHAEAFEDRNQVFRRAVCDHFRLHPTKTPLPLIAALYTAETEFAREAWSVNRVVSALAQEMLERGGTEYLDVYIAGAGRGFDALLESARISLSPARCRELTALCEQRRELHRGTQREALYEHMRERFAALPNA